MANLGEGVSMADLADPKITVDIKISRIQTDKEMDYRIKKPATGEAIVTIKHSRSSDITQTFLFKGCDSLETAKKAIQNSLSSWSLHILFNTRSNVFYASNIKLNAHYDGTLSSDAVVTITGNRDISRPLEISVRDVSDLDSAEREAFVIFKHIVEYISTYSIS